MGISFVGRNENAKSYYLKATETMRAFGGGTGCRLTAKKCRTKAMGEGRAGDRAVHWRQGGHKYY
jgi:hypothetical protein